MRLILSFLVLVTICSSVHSNTIYRKYRELDVPVPSANEEIIKEEILDELKKDQIPVRIEIVEPVIILKEKSPVELPAIESGRNVEVEPVVGVVEKLIKDEEKLIVAIEPVVVDRVKIVETEPVEQSRSVEPVLVDRIISPVEAKIPVVVVPESVEPVVLETLRNIENIEKVVDVPVVDPVGEVVQEAVRNIEPEKVDEVVVEPVVVPVEEPLVAAESSRNVESVVASDVSRKVEQVEEIVEKKTEIENEMVAAEAVRNIEPEVSLLAVVPLQGQTLIAEIEPSVAEQIVAKEKLRSILPVVEEKIVVPVEIIEVKNPVEVEVKQKEEILLRSVEQVEPKPKEAELLLKGDEKPSEKVEEKVVEKVEEKKVLKEELKEENALRAIPDVVVPVPKDDEKVEQLIVNEGDAIEAVRQNSESTTPGNVIQQLLQNNPLTNFIQSIRPQSAASTTQKPAQSDELVESESTTAATTAQPPNLIQQIATGIQGFQANVQGLFTGAQAQGQGEGSTQRPFAFITNLFPGQQQQQTAQTGTSPPTGGNVPPNPIQGFLGLFNGNRVATNSPSSTTLASPTVVASTVDDKVDEVKGSDEIESNETFENDPEIYVGEPEDNSAAIY